MSLEAGKLSSEVESVLSAARESHESVGLIMQLGTARDGRTGNFQQLTEELIESACAATKEKPVHCKTFPNLGAMLVEASPEFLENLAQRQEVVSVMPNRPSRESKPILPIRPVTKREPRKEDWKPAEKGSKPSSRGKK